MFLNIQVFGTVEADNIRIDFNQGLITQCGILGYIYTRCLHDLAAI